jgi:hypothetical protein
MGIDGTSGAMAVCMVAMIFGLFVVGLPQWITDGIVAASGVGLIYAARAWWAASTGRRAE